MPFAVLALLGALTAVAPISLDLYLAAFPQIRAELGVAAWQVQLTMTACMIGLAVGQLIGGIASDSRGRRTPLITGMVLFTLASIACIFAPDIWTLVAARFLQGIGGGAGIVVARAVIRDRTSGEAMVRALTTTMILLGLGPILAPMLGGWMLQLTDWRGVFGVLAVLAAILLVGSLFLRESLPTERRRTAGLSATLRDFRAVVADPHWRYGAGTVALTSTAVFVYIGASSFIFQDIFGLSATAFGVLFGIMAMNFMLFSQTNRILGRWLTPTARLGISVVGISIAAGVLATAALVPDPPVWLAILGCGLLPASHGLGSPNGIAIALEHHDSRAGSASALQGVIQFLLGAAAVPLVGEALGSLAIAVGVIAVLLVILRATNARTSTPEPVPDTTNATPVVG